jgi:hypothetical protein
MSSSEHEVWTTYKVLKTKTYEVSNKMNIRVTSITTGKEIIHQGVERNGIRYVKYENTHIPISTLLYRCRRAININ